MKNLTLAFLLLFLGVACSTHEHAKVKNANMARANTYDFSMANAKR